MGPRIETERLLMRLPEMGDAPNLSTYCGDIDVSRMTSRIPHPYPVLAAEMWVLATRAGWRPDGNQSLVIEADGETIGGGGIFKRSPESDWELGYWVGRPWWGMGYATEIGRGMVEFAHQALGAQRVVAGHYDDNPASGRVLEKLGFRYTGEARKVYAMARLGKARLLDMVWDGPLQ